MNTLQELEQRYPEWRPCLAAVGEVLVELDNRAWDAAVPALGTVGNDAPLVAAARLDPAQMPIPLLHACRRRWADAVPQSWTHGYCPVCGAWPGFAELCGVERARYLRCVRCGSAWRAHALSCVYCASTDHAALGSLVAETGEPTWAIEVCKRCRGYLKAFTRLRVGAPEQAMLDDLASVELDLAAESRGYRRPQGAGYEVHVAA